MDLRDEVVFLRDGCEIAKTTSPPAVPAVGDNRFRPGEEGETAQKSEKRRSRRENGWRGQKMPRKRPKIRILAEKSEFLATFSPEKAFKTEKLMFERVFTRGAG